MARVLMIDNYDSFTWNLVQYLYALGAEVDVRPCDAVSLDDACALAPDAVVISPGPCTPREAGISVPLVRRLAGVRPILGVCLGHQAIGAAFGAPVIRACRPMHGKTSLVHHDGRGLFAGLSEPFEAMRYHSLVLDLAALPPSFECTAWTDDGEVMGIRHREWPVEGVQFHPESILTPTGMSMLARFVERLPQPAAVAAAGAA